MQFSGLGPKLIKSWSHLFCFEKCQGFMLEVPLPSSLFPAAEAHQCERPHTSRPCGVEAWRRLNPRLRGPPTLSVQKGSSAWGGEVKDRALPADPDPHLPQPDLCCTPQSDKGGSKGESTGKDQHTELIMTFS